MVVCNSCKKCTLKVSFSFFFFFFLTFLVVALSAVVLCVYNDVVLGLTWVAAKEKFIFEPQAKMSRKKLAAQQLNCNTVSKTQPFSFFFFFHHQLCAILIHKGTVWHFLSVVCCIVFGSFVGSLKVSFFWCCTYCCFLLPNKKKTNTEMYYSFVAAVTVSSSGAIRCRLPSSGCTIQVMVIIRHLLSGRHHPFDRGS